MLFILDRWQKTVGVASNSNPLSLPYFDDMHTENLEGVSTYEFTVPAEHEDSNKLEVNGHIILRDLDGEHILFTIKEIQEGYYEGKLTKKVFCENTAIDELLGDVQRPLTLSSTTLENAALTVLNSTDGRWKLGDVEIDWIQDVVFEDYMTVLEALRQITTEFGAEMYFTVTLEGTEIVEKIVHIVEKRGIETQVRFDYSYNLIGVARTEDSTRLVTALIGVGKGDSEGNRVTLVNYPSFDDGDFYHELSTDWIGSDKALQQWSKDGKHIFGIFIDEESDTAEKLKRRTLNELTKRSKPYMFYASSVVTLEQLTGYEAQKVRLGDTVTIKDITFNPPIVISARVQMLERSYTDPSQDHVDLGEYQPITISPNGRIISLQNTISKNEEKWNAALTESQVDTKIETRVQPVETVATEAKTTAETAEQVANDANTKATSAEQKADSAVDAVNNREYAIVRSDTTPTGFYEIGQLWLKTDTNIFYRWTGSSWQEVGGYTGLETRMTAAESTITQNTEQIGLRVTKAVYDIDVPNLQSRMTAAESSITLNSDSINLKVDKNGVIGAINLSSEGTQILGRHLLVGDFTNLCENPDFELDTVGQGALGYNKPTFARVVDITGFQNGNGSSKALEVDARSDGNADIYADLRIPVSPGDSFFLSFEGRYFSTVGTGMAKIGVRYYDKNKQALGWTTAAELAKTTSFTKASGSYTVPSNVGYIQLWLSFGNNGETTNKAYFDNIRFHRMSGTDLLVGGSITASHIKSLNGLNVGNGKFVIDANGNVTFAGTLSGASGTFNGKVETVNSSTGDRVIIQNGKATFQFDGQAGSTNVLSYDGALVKANGYSGYYSSSLLTLTNNQSKVIRLEPPDHSTTNTWSTLYTNATSLRLGASEVWVDSKFNFASYLESNQGRVIQATDAWLRLNPSGNFTNGIYCGTSFLRTDGSFQVGNTTSAGLYVTTSTLQYKGDQILRGYSGTAKAVYRNSTQLSVRISYNITSGSTARVVATPRWISGNVSMVKVATVFLENVTTSYADIRVYCDSDYVFNTGDEMYIDWIAVPDV